MVTENNIIDALRRIDHYFNIYIPLTDVLAQYAEPHRYFHTISHIKNIIDNINSHIYRQDIYTDMYIITSDDEAILLLAAIFHDIIYYPDRTDNEEKSIEFLNKYVVENNSEIEKVKEIILSTKNHNSDDVLCNLFNTFDCSIMDQDYEKLLVWEEGIKSEYSFVDLKTYKEKRIEFLNDNIIKHSNNINNLKKLISFIKTYKNSVDVRCYRTDCKYNEFTKTNCGYCLKIEIQLTNDGCMDYMKIQSQ
jgi:predicted metal-dependent HD superfamily phosphohydrolase